MELLSTFIEIVQSSPVIPTEVSVVSTSGFYQSGDDGRASYVFSSSEPDHPAKFQAQDGRWFCLSDTQLIYPEMFGAVGDGVQDDEPAINSALGASVVSILNLLSKSYAIAASIVIPSGKTLRGTGRLNSRISVLSTFDYAANNTSVHVDPASADVRLADFMIDVNKVNLGLGIPTRICATGIGGTNFSLERVDVWNASGYGHWSNGGTSLTPASGLLIDCRSYNCQIAFEQNHCDGVTLIDCRALPGDSDIPCESFFHPLFGANNIIHIGCSAKGMAGGGIVPALNTNLDNIQFINCDIEMTNAASALFVETLGTSNILTGLLLIGTRLRSQGGQCAILQSTVNAVAAQCEIQGGVGLSVRENSSIRVTDCVVKGYVASGGVASAVGISASPGSTVKTLGGIVSAEGPNINLPVSGTGVIDLDPSTRVSPSSSQGYVIRNSLVQISNVPNAGGSGFGNLSGAFIGANDTAGNVTRISLQGATGSQVYLESVVEANAYASFKLRIRGSGGMTERLSVSPDGAANWRGLWMVSGDLSVNVPAASAGFLRWRVDNENKAYVCLGGDAKSMFSNVESDTGNHYFQLKGVVKAQISSDKLNIPAASSYRVGDVIVVGARRTGWTNATGTASRASFETYVAPLISNPPTQAEVQAIADHLEILSQHQKALIDDLHANSGHGLIG